MQPIGGRNTPRAGFLVLGLVFLLILLFSGLQTAHSHGGKTHGEDEFTALQAVIKATQLYDRLIAAGKLSEGWETGLKSIEVRIEEEDGNREYIIQFETTAEQPRSVYFFFDKTGKYAGSNYTGE